MTDKVRLEVLDTTSCSCLNKQFTYCWLLSEILPQHHLLNSKLKESYFRFAVTSATTVSLCRAIAMRILSLEKSKRGIVSNEFCHSGLMFIGIVILQAWPNEGVSQSKPSRSSTYNHKIRFCKYQRYQNILAVESFLSTFFFVSVLYLYSNAYSKTLSMETFSQTVKSYRWLICFKLKHRKIYLWLGFVTFLQQKTG